ncbi:zinc finger MYM-type protein 1-like protein [Tanacetum coccineum]
MNCFRHSCLWKHNVEYGSQYYKIKTPSSSYLKSSFDKNFAKNHLSVKQLRGQGYDGASNMRGEFNGLKAKILEENDSAYYVHCFAHQLQLVVVAVAKNHLGVVDFFDKLSLVTNVVCDSCKRKDILVECEKVRVEKAIGNGEVETGSALQKRDQDVVEAVSLVKSTKEQLKEFRLALILPVATASVERCFSAMKIVKSDLRNRIGENFLNSCVISAVEREALANVKDEDVMKRL